MEQYYINYSFATGRWLVKQVGEGNIIKTFNSKIEAEDFIKIIK